MMAANEIVSIRLNDSLFLMEHNNRKKTEQELKYRAQQVRPEYFFFIGYIRLLYNE